MKRILVILISTTLLFIGYIGSVETIVSDGIHSCECIATVTDKNLVGGRYVYDLAYHAGREYCVNEFAFSSREDIYDVEDILTVYYNPRNPLMIRTHRYTAGVCSVFAIMLAAGVAGYIFIIYRYGGDTNDNDI